MVNILSWEGQEFEKAVEMNQFESTCTLTAKEVVFKAQRNFIEKINIFFHNDQKVTAPGFKKCILPWLVNVSNCIFQKVPSTIWQRNQTSLDTENFMFLSSIDFKPKDKLLNVW